MRKQNSRKVKECADLVIVSGLKPRPAKSSAFFTVGDTAFSESMNHPTVSYSLVIRDEIK